MDDITTALSEIREQVETGLSNLDKTLMDLEEGMEILNETMKRIADVLEKHYSKS